MTMNSETAEILQAVGGRGTSVLLRSETATAATESVLEWAAEQGWTVVDLGGFYGTDLRGAPSVGGDPLVSARGVPPWVVELETGEGPRMLLLPDVVALSASMTETNTSVLRTLLKDRHVPGRGTLPEECFVLATAADDDGVLPGLSGDALMHLSLT
jgi:hypothetical protein